ncbi:MAG: thiamine pyrophosphate-dependent dehydrogenase E1 component subunit alpha [Alphaproteobacteria bacterium]
MAGAGQNVDLERLKLLHLTMARIRAFEEAALDALGRGLVLGAIHPSIGQEAVAVGVCSQLRLDDVLLSTHRGHGHTLAKGADPTAMMAELFGREGGTCGGKGGSMHIADFEVGMLGANGVVAANIPIAAGAAHAIKLRGEDRIVVCIFGDGAINRGPFLEGLNWARIYDLPILFVCEDNGFAATTRTEDLTAGEGPAARAESLGIPAVKVDGNNVLAVADQATDLIARIRGGEGPKLLVAETYRLTGHTGADPAAYRSDDEVAEARTRDPLLRSSAWLEEAGLDRAAIAALERGARDEIDAARKAAEAAPWPEQGAAYRDVQDIGAELRARAHG